MTIGPYPARLRLGKHSCRGAIFTLGFTIHRSKVNERSKSRWHFKFGQLDDSKIISQFSLDHLSIRSKFLSLATVVAMRHRFSIPTYILSTHHLIFGIFFPGRQMLCNRLKKIPLSRSSFIPFSIPASPGLLPSISLRLSRILALYSCITSCV